MEVAITEFHKVINHLYENRKVIRNDFFLGFWDSSEEMKIFIKNLKKTKDPTVNFYLQNEDLAMNHSWGRVAAIKSLKIYKNSPELNL